MKMKVNIDSVRKYYRRKPPKKKKDLMYHKINSSFQGILEEKTVLFGIINIHMHIHIYII